MNVNLRKNDIINLIKATPVSYRSYTSELNEAGKWSFDMNGPTTFNWNYHWLESKTEEYLYDFYQKLYRGDFYLPEDNEPVEYAPVQMPMARRQFPILSDVSFRNGLR